MSTKKILKLFGILLTVWALVMGAAYAASVLTVPQGGTGGAAFNQYPIVGAGSNGALTASSTLWVVGINATSTTASSTFAHGISAAYLSLTGTAATSTFANGLIINGGCILYQGLCLGATAVGANPTASIGLSAVNGSAVTFMRSDGAPALDQSIAPTWTGLHKFNTGGFISTASSTAQYFNSASSSFGTIAAPSLTSALLLTNGNGVFAEYAGSTCTNQAVTAISALGAATCTTLDGNYLDLTAGYTWSGAHVFTSGSLRLPNGASPTVDAAGEIALDTTSGQLKVYDGFAANIFSATSTFKFTVSAYATDTASHAFSSGTSSWATFFPDAITVKGIGCMASSTGGAIMRVTDGTNHVGEVICKATTPGRNTSLSNTTFTAFEPLYIEIGSTTSTDPSFVSPVMWYGPTAD